MTIKVIVLVADRDDSKHGEIAVLDSTGDAERLVETFLEAGYEQERVRVFTGAEMDAQVTHRPKVVLLSKELDALDPVDPPRVEVGVQPADGLSAAHGAVHDTQNGSSTLISSLAVQPVEMMPELLH